MAQRRNAARNRALAGHGRTADKIRIWPRIVASVEALPISEPERDNILAGNARRLFGVRA